MLCCFKTVHFDLVNMLRTWDGVLQTALFNPLCYDFFPHLQTKITVLYVSSRLEFSRNLPVVHHSDILCHLVHTFM
jgi:hypothetical protein